LTQQSDGVIRFNEPYITGNELGYISQVFDNRHFQGNGPFTKKCQSWLEEHLDVNAVLLTDSCTSALEISALLLKKEGRNEVIVPSYTFSSTASAFARAGYTIRFAEIHPDTMMMDIDHVSTLVNANTRAIVPVHYAGLPSNIEAFKGLCDRDGISLVEDAAQALGTSQHGKKMGAFGRLSCFSFHETKNIHAGLAGALVINDPSLVDRATYIWERGTNRQAVLQGLVDKYTWVEVGGSFYPTELQAAFLFAQLESLDENIGYRRQIYEAYDQGLSSLKGASKLHFPVAAPNTDLNYHAFFVVFRSEEECERTRQHLVANQIHAYIGYIPLHSSPVGQSMGYKPDSLPVTEAYAPRVLRLPFHNNMTAEDALRVCQEIKVVLEDA
jgi:dTDP-4-amino-4,6-dideoxygalactose transaminase